MGRLLNPGILLGVPDWNLRIKLKREFRSEALEAIVK